MLEAVAMVDMEIQRGRTSFSREEMLGVLADVQHLKESVYKTSEELKFKDTCLAEYGLCAILNELGSSVSRSRFLEDCLGAKRIKLPEYDTEVIFGRESIPEDVWAIKFSEHRFYVYKTTDKGWHWHPEIDNQNDVNAP